MIKYYLLSILLLLGFREQIFSQTVLGNQHQTQLKVYEYYNHTGQEEWIRLFRVYNHNADLGFWGKGGVAGTLYFVDYQGEGASYVNFSFPQGIKPDQKPVLTLSGNSADDIQWYAFEERPETGQEYYDVYIKAPGWHVGLTFLLRQNDAFSFFAKNTPPSIPAVWSSLANQESITYFKGNGNVGLGTLNPAEKLSVNGNIRAKEIKVETANWPDYVFTKDHSLPSLKEVENFIETNHHLPEMPGAKEAETEGISLGEMNAKLLKKIEELTLYIIDMNKKVINQQAEINQLKNQTYQR